MMALREFVDSVGVPWKVWMVMPAEMSDRLARLSGAAAERRKPWLAFQSAEGEKRRLVPVPDGWESCDDYTLERWAMRAVQVPPAPALREADAADPPVDLPPVRE